jgi:hypothetical protein
MRPKEEQQNMPPIRVMEIHQWRDAWRKARGKGKLWGNEPKLSIIKAKRGGDKDVPAI